MVASTDGTVIDIQDLHKAYRTYGTTTPVLKGVDWQVQQGQFVFLVGPSGSGKSTLLSILGCVLQADQGRVRILGEDLAALDESQRIELRRDRIGFVFQRFHLIRGLSVLDNVSVPLVLKNISNREAAHRSKELLAEVGLADRASADPRKLSVGQCQRVALARALAGEPDLILADEPTASLDEDNGRRIMELMKNMITEKRTTGIVVTHDQRIFGFADRVCRMEDGKVFRTSFADNRG